MHQPQEIRFAIAMAPSTMTRMTATGVSQARMFVCSAVAPGHERAMPGRTRGQVTATVRRGEQQGRQKAEGMFLSVS